ncbi:MAG: TonB-dependent hemoglobin/transferrin/lactoferrin family receptor [Acidobacteriota bacterium]|nr:TonB-dependent hemoglobin/transferrin/lactoferrin family receptor [Acidobacteriota bacterium]
MTVTAERTPVPIKEATAKVSVIDDSRIEDQLINDVRDLVKYEPGVYVGNNGTRLGLNGFNIRGIGGNRVLTRVDGVTTSEQFDFGPFNIHQYAVDVDTLKAVEIVRSSASSLYGSDALGGVVSFVTKDPSDYIADWQQDQGFIVKTGYDGETESVDLGLTGVFTVGEYQGLLTAVRREFGERDNQGELASLDATRTAPNDIDGSSTQILGKLVRNLSVNNRLRFSLELFDSAADANVYTSQGASSMFGVVTEITDYTADDSQERLRLSVDQEMREMESAWADTLQWRLHWQQAETNQETLETRISTVGPVTTNILRTGTVDFEQDNLGAELLLGKTFETESTMTRITYGLTLERTEFGQIRDRRDLDLDTGNPDAYTGSLIFPTRYFPNSTVDEYGAFVQAETYFLDGRLKITPGLRFDDYSLSPDENDTIFLESTGTTEPPAGLDDDSVSPKLGIYAQLSDHVAWTGHYAHGFRAPAYSSVNSGFTNVAGGYQTLPNPELTPETSDNLETGLKLFGKRGSLSLTYFDNSFEDFIADSVFVGVSQTGLALFQALNLNNVEISGLELAGDYMFYTNWSLRFSYADIDGEDEDSGDPIESIQPPKGVVGISWRQSQNRYGGELTGTFVTSKSDSDVAASDPPAFLPDSYNLVDLTLFYRLSDQFRLNLGAFNLTDETYYLWSDVRGRSADDPVITRYSAPGRNLSFNLRYQW